MKRLVAILLAAVLAAFQAAAQDINTELPQDGELYEVIDTVVYRSAAVIDSTLAGKNILYILPDNVRVNQSQSVSDAFALRLSENSTREINGYRVRIYFDNKQSSRVDSEEVLKRFRSLYPGIPAYRSFANPFFKVTVGDFRTRSEAMETLQKVKAAFPSAFILKEKISYPVVDKNNSYVVDTLHIIRKIETNDEVVDENQAY